MVSPAVGPEFQGGAVQLEFVVDVDGKPVGFSIKSTTHEALAKVEIEAETALKQKILDMPAVKAAFEAFPDAELAAWNLDERRSG